jgi:hypothetical protein
MGAPSSRSFALLTVLLAGSMVGPVSIFAQDAVAVLSTGATTQLASTSDVTLGARTTSHAAGPSTFWPDGRVTWSPFAEPASVSPFAASPSPQERVRAGTNVALMGVGGAVLVAGMIMGGEDGKVVATAGGVIAVVGLYRYLQ